MIVDRTDLIQNLKNVYVKYNAPIKEINVFGIRDESNQSDDLFNDWLGIMTSDKVYIWKGTTDPGINSLNKSGGAAHLCPGYQPDIWVIDTHAKTNPLFAHKALCSRPNLGCLPTKIWRDANKTTHKDEQEKGQSGYFGMNFHRASAVRLEQKIGLYSEGCQVTQDKKDFDFCMNLILNSQTYLTNNKATFSYMLILSGELEL